MLKVGERAPEFTLPDETETDRSLTELLTTGAIILYFYPADFTRAAPARPVRCAICMRKFRRPACASSASARKAPRSHAKFREKYRLPYVLLSDEHKTVIKMYGLNGPLGIGVRRATYLIDGGRRVRDAVLADFLVGRHAEFVRKAIMLRVGEQLVVQTLEDWRGRCAAP